MKKYKFKLHCENPIITGTIVFAHAENEHVARVKVACAIATAKTDLKLKSLELIP